MKTTICFFAFLLFTFSSHASQQFISDYMINCYTGTAFANISATTTYDAVHRLDDAISTQKSTNSALLVQFTNFYDRGISTNFNVMITGITTSTLYFYHGILTNKVDL